ncbi:MAG: AAA family ATPase [Micrococcales bacterium]|nr:AAA family ATPase [Micrococcales bacterium]
MTFSGRERDLAVLTGQWRKVVDGSAASRGRAVVVTGRRRVGKSRLVQEFVDRLGAPAVVFQATRGRHPASERADLAETVAACDLPDQGQVVGLAATDWNQALRLLALALPADTASVVVLDEVPWLMAEDPEFEGALQTVWDRHLSQKPVLVILVGSDLSMMQSLQSHERAFFGRAATMTVEPLHLADVAHATALAGPDAVDAWLTTGGFPEIVASWPRGCSWEEFVRQSLADPLSPLLVSAQLTLLGEFPGPSVSRRVLEAIGAGERTFATVAAAASPDQGLTSGTLAPVLQTLQTRRAIAVDLPLSTANDTRNRRYRIADPYLRFWLAFGADMVALAERGRPDLALARVERSWAAWRGRAVEPLVRMSLERLLPDDQWPQVMTVGGWWNRQNNPEVDLVGADRAGRHLGFVGSVKWHQTQPFDHHDLAQLLRDAPRVPGTTPQTPVVAVSRNGAEPGLPLAACWTPDDLVGAWR